MLFKHGNGHGQLGPDIVGDQVGKVARLAHASTSLQQRTPSGRARFAGPDAGLDGRGNLAGFVDEAAAVGRDLNALPLARLVQRLRWARDWPQQLCWDQGGGAGGAGWGTEGGLPCRELPRWVRGSFSLVKATLIGGVLLGNGASGPTAIPMARPAPEAHART